MQPSSVQEATYVVKLQGQPGKSRFESEKIWGIFGANGARQFKPIKTASPISLQKW